jgi:hypothetical protein
MGRECEQSSKPSHSSFFMFVDPNFPFIFLWFYTHSNDERLTNFHLIQYLVASSTGSGHDTISSRTQMVPFALYSLPKMLYI